MAASLRSVVLTATGQDVRKCWHCSACSEIADDSLDVSLEMLLQMIVMNDEEVLTTRALWSPTVLERAEHQCPNSLNLSAVLLALRTEAERRGVLEMKRET